MQFERQSECRWGNIALSLYLVLWALAAAAQQTYPRAPVRIIIPQAPGGSVDLVSRALAKVLGDRNGQTFLIENRDGANTIVAATVCARAKPDGYTACILNLSTIALNPLLYKDLPYDAARDFDPVTVVMYAQGGIVMHPSITGDSVAAMVEYSKQNPGKINYGSLGAGNAYLVLAWLQKKTGADITHVPYKNGTAALQALIAGQIHLLQVTLGQPGLVPAVQTGKLKLLAVQGTQRAAQFPNVPSMAEVGLGEYNPQLWFALFMPAGAPQDVVNKLQSEVAAVIRDKDFESKFLAPTLMVAGGEKPAEFREFLIRNRQEAAGLVRSLGVKPE